MLWSLVPGFALKVIAAIGGEIGRAADRETERRRIEANRQIAERQAMRDERVEEIRANAQIMLKEMGNNPWLRALRPLFGYLILIYFAHIVFYSLYLCQKCMFPQPWTFAELPPSVAPWAGLIMTTYFGSRAVEKVAPGLIDALRGRK